jgi:hypothetical protein
MSYRVFSEEKQRVDENSVKLEMYIQSASE